MYMMKNQRYDIAAEISKIHIWLYICPQLWHWGLTLGPGLQLSRDNLLQRQMWDLNTGYALMDTRKKHSQWLKSVRDEMEGVYILDTCSRLPCLSCYLLNRTVRIKWCSTKVLLLGWGGTAMDNHGLLLFEVIII